MDAHVGGDDSQEGPTGVFDSVVPDALALLGSAEDHMFIMVTCPYAGLDWRGCPSILFTLDEPLNDRGDISV